MIEGDGSIKVPASLRSTKGNLLYPSVTIVFVEKDLPLGTLLAEALKGTINKASGGWYVLSVYRLSALYQLAQLLNGKFRTPKIEALDRLITWLNNYGKFDQIKLLAVDESAIASNAWLAGFSDCDSNFLVYFTNSDQGIAKNISLTYRLSQRQEYHRISSSGTSYLPVLSSIATALDTKVTAFERERFNAKTNTPYVEKGYMVTVKSLSSRLALIDYFNQFPLLSAKRFDYFNWVEAHELVQNRLYRTVEGTAKLQQIKSSMNSQRTSYNWEHLDSLSKEK
jgi:hypothetical protein